MSILDTILENHETSMIVSENHDLGTINAQAALMDEAELGKQYSAAEIEAMRTNPARQREARRAAQQRASLDTTGGRVRMFAAGELPWHGLGVRVDRAASSAQAIQFAGLDWLVEKHQLNYEFAGTSHIAEGQYGVIRQDTGEMLGAVGSRYKPIQNVHGFDFLDSVLARYGAKYDTAGSLYGGKQVWMLAHFPVQAFALPGKDKIEPYVIFSNCHDGTGAAWCYPTTVRVTCANTFRISSMSRSKGLSIRHTGDLKGKIASAQTALGMAVNGFEEFEMASKEMCHRTLNIHNYANDVLDAVLDVTAAQVKLGADVLAATLDATEASRELARKSFAAKIERRGEILEDILERYESERCGIGSIRGTAWAAFNAITEHADHAEVGKQARDLVLRQSRRFESAIAGDADTMKQEAFRIAVGV